MRERHVTAHLELDVRSPATLDLRIAAARADGLTVVDELSVLVDGTRIEPTLVDVVGEGDVHQLRAPAGRLVIDYRATVTGAGGPQQVTAADRVVFLRPSRYAESDTLTATARSEFAGITDPAQLLADVSSWVGQHLAYVSGSSRPTDGAVATLLQREGVCRDYAHLVVALLRALDVPARTAAVYAPGLDPMDFHAVAEAAIGDAWYVTDATLLAPRQSLLRIGTGRDAADTAFLSTYDGAVELTAIEVTATADELPFDDLGELVSIA